MLIIVILVSSVCTSNADDDDDDHNPNFENKKIYNEASLKSGIEVGRERLAKLVLLCEQETCPYSKKLTKELKKALKKTTRLNSLLLRIEE